MPALMCPAIKVPGNPKQHQLQSALSSTGGQLDCRTMDEFHWTDNPRKNRITEEAELQEGAGLQGNLEVCNSQLANVVLPVRTCAGTMTLAGRKTTSIVADTS